MSKYFFSAVATELSAQSSIQRVIAFQGLLSDSTSAEFIQTFHPDTTAFGAFAEPQHSSCYRVFGGWIFCGERPLSRKKASTSRCSQPRRHGLFLSSPLHYPRQGYHVTIMNPFRGKARLSRAPSQDPIPLSRLV